MSESGFKPITPGQMQRLQVLWKQQASRDICPTKDMDRQARLDWASQQLGHLVTSFKELSNREAHKLIELLQGGLGISNSRPSRQRAHAMGNEGRRGRRTGVVTMADARDLAGIQQQLARLGWSQNRLESFLAASSSPLRGRTQIRTKADANRVFWALKNMANRMEGQRHG